MGNIATQSATDNLVAIVRGFNEPLAQQLTSAISAERISNYYSLRHREVNLDILIREVEAAETLQEAKNAAVLKKGKV